MNLGEQIRKLRKSKSLTMKDLGTLVGLSEQAIGNYERGDREPNIETLQKIADALNVSFSELVPTDDLQLASDYLRLKVLAEKKGLINNPSDGHIIKDYFNQFKNPSRFILKNSFSVDVDLLTDDQIEELMRAIEFAIKLKLEEFQINNKEGE